MNTTPQAIEVTDAIIEEHGLTKEEFEKVCEILGRTPSMTELGVFSVMWSEHCSYKSSRLHLSKLHTEGEQVICGPGENAGVIDIGDNHAAIFKMESHNHPSFIEPYQGAATGVGGIMRDVFTMGARPVALMNALRFGEAGHEKTRHLVSGVVAGIGGYGNCMGVPTVGGEVNFHKNYNGNILVNAMCVGLADKDNIFYSAATGVGNPVVYVGSKTGRDGIHGATMASAEFDDDSEEKRPTVQVGDPFTEKLLLEACLELMAEDAIIGIQDMGAAGLTSSSVEMADKGGVGFALELDKVPCREEAMTAYEMMLSESQERMLMTLRPGREDIARKIFEKWELDFAIIGITTDTGRLVVSHNGIVEADMPVSKLADSAPIYDRPSEPTPAPTPINPEDISAPEDVADSLLKLMGSPDLCSRRWIWEQYDHMVMRDTVARPGGDAAIVRVHDTNKGLCVSTDVTPRYVKANPFEGGKQAVAETYRNITATGGTPLAITNCLNFASPERPKIMGQFVDAVEGISAAAKALNYPVISGNVSFYNETNGVSILPTPAIGGVGKIDDIETSMSLSLKDEGDILILIGAEEGHLGQSLYLRDICDREDGDAPSVDLDAEKANGGFVREMILAGNLTAAHDISDGGLLVALAEMSIAGDMGAELNVKDTGVPEIAALFGEDQARYILSTRAEKSSEVLQAAEKRNIPARLLGKVTGECLIIDGSKPISVKELKEVHEKWLPDYMSGG